MDIETQQAMDPKLPDLLRPTATSPRWISPYTYQGLARRLICPGSTIQTPPAQFNLPQLNLGIVMDRPDIYTIVNLPTWIIPSFPPPLNVAGPQFVELRSGDGAVLSRQGVGRWSMPLADGGARYARVSLPWADSAASLALVEGDRTLLALPIEKAPPRLTVDFNPRPAAADKPFALRWRIAGPAGKNRVGILVRASADGGQTWVGIPAPLKGNTMTITPSQLPAGENCVLEVYASRGFRTAHYRSKPFRILRPAPTPVILSPKSSYPRPLGRSGGVCGSAGKRKKTRLRCFDLVVQHRWQVWDWKPNRHSRPFTGRTYDRASCRRVPRPRGPRQRNGRRGRREKQSAPPAMIRKGAAAAPILVWR